MVDELLKELEKNPHFMTLPEVLRNERIGEAAFRNDTLLRAVLYEYWPPVFQQDNPYK